MGEKTRRPSTNSGFISRVDLDGRNDVVIIPQGVTWTPKQLTLEPRTGKLYWSDREGSALSLPLHDRLVGAKSNLE